MNVRKPIAAIAVLLFSGSAFAAGEHAGGHEAGAAGQPGDPARVSRTIVIDMSDAMRFMPASVDVKKDETIRFKVTNSGRLKHEMVLGTPRQLAEHYAMMMKMPQMEHADDNMVAVAPGQTGEIVWQFTRPGTVDFGCLQPGHYDAGMKGRVAVAEAQPASAGHAGH